MNIIGRDSEIEELEERYQSGIPEFVAVYGRRRVGKTFLVKELFANRMTFHHTGVSPQGLQGENSMYDQLTAFYNSMVSQGLAPNEKPKDWLEAFFFLETALQLIDNGQRMVIFIDELPWMDTPRSNFISGLEHFWNSWCYYHDNVMLIVCGSATSWMEDKLINNVGGLYGRLTCQIYVRQFTLNECERFFKDKGFTMSRYDITEAYMLFGGVPMYLGYFQKGKSLAQNVDRMLFERNSKLKLEFQTLFGSLFTSPDTYIKVVRFLAKNRSGYTRSEIIKGTGMKSGSAISRILDVLEANDFIKPYKPFNTTRTIKYKLIDHFCMSWLRFVDGQPASDPHFWENDHNSASLSAWRGLAFEDVCFSHVPQIKKALRISGVGSMEYSMIIRDDNGKADAQIDMLIDRKDNTVNLCEMKFYSKPFNIDSAYCMKLRERISDLLEILPRKKSVILTMITSFGIKNNENSGVVQKSITLDSLFEDDD